MEQQAAGASRAPVVAVGFIEWVAWILGRRIRVRIQGASMQPLLMDGDHVLVQQCTHADIGDVVLFRHPYRTDIRIIKRIQDSTEEGAFLIGDNPEETTDSTSFGRVPWTHLIGRVHSKF